MIDEDLLHTLGELFTRSPDPIYVWQEVDGDILLVGANPAAGDFAHGQLEGLLGLSSDSLPNRVDRVVHRDLQWCLQQGRGLTREFDYGFPGGAERRIHVSYTPVGHDVVLANVRDVDHLWQRANDHEDRARELEMLTGMTRRLLEAEDGQRTRDLLCAAALDLADADMVFLIEPRGPLLAQTASARKPDAPDFTVPSVDLVAGPGSLVRAAYSSQRSIFVPDLVADPRAHEVLHGVAATAAAFFEPVRAGDGVVGLLIAAWAFPMPAAPERTSRLMPLLAGHAGLAINRADLLERLNGEAVCDPLTGLPNRRAADAELDRQLHASRRTGRPLSVCVLDLNGLKAVNDRHGHDAGDALLTRAACGWRAALRAEDQLARVGGDEFVVVMPDTDAFAAQRLLHRLTTATPEISAAVGYAEWDREQTATELLAAADAAMYADKRGE